MNQPLVDTQTIDGVAVVCLNNPAKRNVLSMDLVDALIAAIDHCERDAEIHAIVLTGAGSAFCAGADRADLAAAADGDTDRLRRIYAGFLRVAECSLPTIAAVNGPAVGAGLNLALSCDVRIAGWSARFDCRFLQLALHPGGGHTWLLSRAAGPYAAAMLLFGESLDGPSAAAAGLALRCVDDERLLQHALALARRAADTPRELLALTKRTLREAATAPDHATMLDVEFDRQIWSIGRPEFRSRVGA